MCPEGKLTREIARDPRYGMPVRVLVLDEFQEYFDLGAISKDIAALLVFLAKVAPGAGVILIGATQKPSGIGARRGRQAVHQLPRQPRGPVRAADLELAGVGGGARARAPTARAWTPPRCCRSTRASASCAAPPTPARPCGPTWRTAQDAEKILTAARGLRERAGTLSGMAAGLRRSTATSRDVLADVLQVFGADTGLHWQVLAERLDAQLPDRWADATAEAVSAECRALGVPSVDVKQFGRALKGCRRADVLKAAGQ